MTARQLMTCREVADFLMAYLDGELANNNVVYCEFQVSRAKSWRASLFVSPSPAGAGTDVVVIPAH